MTQLEISKPSIRVANPYEVFHGDSARIAALKEVEGILKGIQDGEFGEWKLDLFFRDDPGMQTFMKSPHPDLGQETPLELLQERVDVLGIRSAGPFTQLSNRDDLASLSAATTFVHLSRGTVITIAAVRKILDLCPNLERIQIPPGFKPIVGPGIRGMLSERGIELNFERLKHNDSVDD
ncbi:MAG: hypothetical protein AAB685_01140 [Patescibacteria group bacterium]